MQNTGTKLVEIKRKLSRLPVSELDEVNRGNQVVKLGESMII